MILPEFAEGIHYTKPRSKKYRFLLLADVSITLPQLKGHKRTVSFRDHTGKEWARMTGEILTIRKDYAWDGCSPSLRIPVIGWIGTPTPYATILASLIHDTLFQFMWAQYFPLTLKQSNEAFFDILKAHNFRWANTYYGAVTDFGKFFAGKTPMKGDHSFLIA